MLVPTDADAVAYLATFRTSAEAVTRARNVASRLMREAINVHFVCPASLDAFPTSPDGVEIRELVGSHALALAAYELSRKGKAAVAKTVAVERNSAKGWMTRARSGELDLSPLPRRSSGNAGGQGRRIAVVGTSPSRIDSDVWKAWDGV